MLNIVLLCQYGASTGLVADKIVEAAKKLWLMHIQYQKQLR